MWGSRRGVGWWGRPGGRPVPSKRVAPSRGRGAQRGLLRGAGVVLPIMPMSITAVWRWGIGWVDPTISARCSVEASGKGWLSTGSLY
jgi:hypothetical protein